MDAYEDKVENGGPVNNNEKMLYYTSKTVVGEGLSMSEQNDYSQSFGVVL